MSSVLPYTLFYVLALTALVALLPHRSKLIGTSMGTVGVFVVMWEMVVYMDTITYISADFFRWSVVALAIAYWFPRALAALLRYPAIKLGNRVQRLQKIQERHDVPIPSATVSVGRPLKAPALRPREDIVVTPREVRSHFSLLSTDVFTISLTDVVNETMLKRFRKDCRKALASDATTIRVEIDSCGGVTTTAMMIRQMIRELSKLKRVETVVTGLCMSAAVGILTSVPVDSRYSLADASFMIHRGQGGGDARILAEHDAELTSRLTEETSIDPASLVALLESGGAYYFMGREAMVLGVVGDIF